MLALSVLTEACTFLPAPMKKPACPIDRVAISAFEVPTDKPEQDGTLSWHKTTLVLVEVSAGGLTSLAYTYADGATAKLIEDSLAPLVIGGDAFATQAAHAKMRIATRNLGGDGITAMAISALDLALWDLKARVLEVPLCALLGAARSRVPVYGSGGFTSYDRETLQRQLAGWVEQGIRKVKIKVGAHPEQDVERVRQAREAIGEHTELFVDANGAHSAKQALRQAEQFARFGVTWFEEPVSSDNLDGLRFVKDHVPMGMDVTAGEYGYRLGYFSNMLQARAVDVMQLDATRCGGVTGFLRAAHVCEAFQIPLSTHCAPALHVHLGAAFDTVRHLEYFHDHLRIEAMLLGARPPHEGELEIASSRPGFGLEVDHARAAQYRISHVQVRAR
ncbi:MAG TPA: enolase C-terminal domain-like protein [Polyangiaceae bacterium]|jgi:L-alanine-DL-glutamate epimerase-like enolase superfamily enzyme|nr:enolase C-terminal domain-like protein [Polyangiaceae bacterium]